MITGAYVRLTVGEFDGYVAFDSIEQATNWVNSKRGDDCTVTIHKIGGDVLGNVEVAHLHYFDQSIALADDTPSGRETNRDNGRLIAFKF